MATPSPTAVSVSGDTTGGPVWNRVIGTSVLSGVGTATPFQTIQIQITNAAAFIAEITTATFDTYMHMYQGDFDPTDQFTNLVAGDEDGGAGLLSLISQGNDGPFAEGQYTIVVSGFSNTAFGTYVLMMDGVVMGWGPTTAEQLDELKSLLAQSGRNNVRILSGTAGAEGEMLAFSGNVGRDFTLNESTILTPYFSVNTGQIELTATSGTLAGAGIADTVNFTETSLGLTMTKSFDNGTFTFGLSADNFDTNAPTALSSGAYDASGWSGSAKFGYSVALGRRTTLDTGVSFGGIGRDTISYSGSVKLSMQF